MKHLNKYKIFEKSLVDKKVDLLKELSLDLTDDGYNVYVIKGSIFSAKVTREIPRSLFLLGICISDDFINDSITVLITYKNYAEHSALVLQQGYSYGIPEYSISTDDFNQKVDDFIYQCEGFEMKYRTKSGGDYFAKIKFDKWGGKTSEYLRDI